MFDTIQINPKEIIFTIKARDMCRSCKRYGKKACCPPYVEPLDYYKKSIWEYANAKIFFKKYLLEDYKNHIEAGRVSSLELNDILLKERTELIKEGYLFATAYGGGSCNICKECTFPCKHPDKSMVPLEAAGIDVFLTLDNLGVTLPSVVVSHFYRVGAVFYD